MRRIAILLLVFVMLLCFAACGEDATPVNTDATVSSQSDVTKPGDGDTTDPTQGETDGNDNPGGGIVEVNADIKLAMEAGNSLTGSYYLLAADGSVITIGESSDNNFAETYSAMADVKKLSLTNVGTAVVALTESGDLYYQNNKIGENVTDVSYCTTNTNVEAFCLMGEDVMWITSDDVLFEFPRNNDFEHIQTKEDIEGCLVSIEVDKHDFAVVNEQGEVFMYIGGSSDAYDALDFSNFKQMAFVDVAKVTKDGAVQSLTVAGLRGDGTTVAVGAYADDILSWGKLSYLTMSDGMIVGLTADGKLKMTGDHAEMMGSIVESWTNIVAVEAGNALRYTGDIVTAVDASGDFYYVSLSDHATEPDSGKISVSNGATGDKTCWKYAPDGKIYRSAENGTWEDITNE